MFHQNMLDLLELYPAATDFHLMVDTAEALQHAVGAPARQIPRPVQAHPAAFRKMVAQEAAAGLFPVVQVAATHADAADIQLSGHANRHRLQVGIQHIEASVGYGPPDRHGRALKSAAP